MLQFKPIEESDAEILASFYRNCAYSSSRYSVGVRLFWNELDPSFFAVNNGILYVRSQIKNSKCRFQLPIFSGNENFDEALNEIDSWCIQNKCRPAFTDIPQDKLAIFYDRYPISRTYNLRNECDYIYKASNLINLKGKHYNGQRNHIAKFKKLYPDYKFRTLTKHDDIDKFWTEYQKESNKNSKDALDELKLAKKMVLFSIKHPNILFNACIEINGELAALTVGEYCGNTMVVQIEKGLRKFDGLYPVIVNEFACHYVKNAEFINREDDAGDKGLRISKTQYHPDILAKKIYFEVEDGLEMVGTVPAINTENLTLVPVAENDFNRIDIVFSVKFQNKVIGEACLYNSNYRGKIEIACRISEEYRNREFDKEVLKTLSNWALYTGNFATITAKCHKDDTSLFSVLSSFMHQTAEDNEFYYFETIV